MPSVSVGTAEEAVIVWPDAELVDSTFTTPVSNGNAFYLGRIDGAFAVATHYQSELLSVDLTVIDQTNSNPVSNGNAFYLGRIDGAFARGEPISIDPVEGNSQNTSSTLAKMYWS